jgi:hypothetical protein
VREALTVCLEQLELWGALTRHDGTCTFTFVAGDFFEVSSRDVTRPSITLLELIYAVFEDHLRELEQNNLLHTYIQVLPTFMPEVSA